MRKQMPAKQQDYVNPELLQKTISQLLEQIAKRDQKISWINAEKTAIVRKLMAEIAEGEAALHHTQDLLRDKESQLHETITSRTWKIALLIQRIRIFLVPLGSRRARLLKRGFNIIISPLKKQ